MIVIDSECYINYWLLSAKHINSGKVRHFELYADHPLDAKTIAAMMRSQTTISFNGNSYDLPMIVAALSGWDNRSLKRLSDKIIKSGFPSWKICRDENLQVPSTWDHIDIINVAPGQSGLKIYGGRMNAPKMQDLPIEPDALIAPEQREQLREYCVNDLDTTEMLYRALEKQVELRAKMSNQYGMDLRSKSDAQIAETVIKSELSAITGKEYRAPQLPDDYGFRYLDPKVISFKADALKQVFKRILSERFTLGPNGSVLMPAWLRENKITIGDAQYQMGIGGLHSCESGQFVKCADDEVLADWDVASYYPNIILQQQLAPESLGAPFLRVYQSIVERRLAAKKRAQEIAKEIAALKNKLAKLAD